MTLLTRLSGSQFQCRLCREHFAGPAAYAIHCARDVEQGQPLCLTRSELRAAGLALTREGFWAIDRTPRSSVLTERVTA
jgi:hypothetical protein